MFGGPGRSQTWQSLMLCVPLPFRVRTEPFNVCAVRDPARSPALTDPSDQSEGRAATWLPGPSPRIAGYHGRQDVSRAPAEPAQSLQLRPADMEGTTIKLTVWKRPFFSSRELFLPTDGKWNCLWAIYSTGVHGYFQRDGKMSATPVSHLCQVQNRYR